MFSGDRWWKVVEVMSDGRRWLAVVTGSDRWLVVAAGDVRWLVVVVGGGKQVKANTQ